MNDKNEFTARQEKLTEWEKEPSVLDLKEDLQAAQAAHDSHVINVKRWNSLRNVSGNYRPKTIKNRSSVQPKLIRRQAEWRYSALSEPFLSSDKMFQVNPVSFEDEFAAEQNELVLNWQFRTKLNPVKFIDEYVRTCVDEGGVIVRLGWDRQSREEPTETPVFELMEPQSQEDVDTLNQAAQMKEADPRGYSGLPIELQASVDYLMESGVPTVAVISGYEEVMEEVVQVNQPTVQVMDPENIFIDPSCQGDITKAGFVIVSFETSKAELLKDGRYKNIESVNWSGNTILSQPDHMSNTPEDFNFKDDLRKRVVAYEYWGYYDVDGKENLRPIVATWIGDVMIRLEDNPFPDEKPPFVAVSYMPVKRALHGEPDAEILEDNQKIIGAVSRGMIDLLGRSANAQQGIAKGFLDVTNRRRFESGQDYEFNPTGAPSVSIHQHTYPEIPTSAINMVAMQNQEAEAISGVKSFSGGLNGNSLGDVATGVRGVLDASAKREMNILRRLAQGVKEVGVKIMAMNAVFLSEEEVVRVTNKKFVVVLREDLKGNFDLIVDISTPEVDETKAQDLGFMLQTMGPNMSPEMSNMILSEIAALKRMPSLAERIRTYVPQPDPIQEQLKQMELSKMQKEIEKLDSEIAYNMARAKEAASKADKTDLDYVEQETGTKHARDLQRQSEQARSNQDLEVTKGLLRAKKVGETQPEYEAAIGYNAMTDAESSAGGIPPGYRGE